MTDTRRKTDIKPELERILELGIFNARWLVAPIYVGLLVP